ncbi:ABC transporter substrate-binding protein [Bombiscardovia nodaiensis]|uniref:ABC transporter substrate-binding protein n=1 Tax=Bombiscardovia nodaiensis TaxID=2932181 RepID=A0ABM8BAC2_9BIFI|nr:ABC transporter substrate-binding protein [Bombiscardovia nodaiensis]
MTSQQQKRLKPGLVFLIALVVLSLIAALIWPLLNHWGQSKAEAAGGRVNIGASQAPNSLDIRTESGAAVTQALLGNVYQTLVGLDENGQPTAGLASSWDRSSDGLTYTFHLRSGETFDDGNTVDSNAVLWSMQQIIKNKYLDYEKLDNLDKVTNPDTNTVVMELKTPDFRLPSMLTSRAGIVYNRGARVNYSTQSAGSGPYTVESFEPGSRLVLRKSQTYRGPHSAKSAQIIFTYKAQSAGQAQQVADGKLDAAVDLSGQEASAARNIKQGVTLSTGVSDQNLVLAFNHSKTAITSDERFRQSIRYALDRQAVADTSGGTAQVLNGPLNKLSPAYDDGDNPFPHDTQKALGLASYFNPSFYGGRIRLVYEDSLGQAVGDSIKDQLKQVGIPVEVTLVDHNTFQDRVVNRHDYELTLLTMSNQDVEQFSKPDSVMLYDDPESQQIFRLVQGANSKESYTSQLKQYAHMLSQKSPADWLSVKAPVNMYRPSLTGLSNNMTESYLPLWQLQMH